MNIGGLARRVTKLERVAWAGQEKQLRFVFQDAGAGETRAEAMKKAGIDEDDASLTIFIMRWATDDEKEYPVHQEPVAAEPAGIDSEIKKLEAELIDEGYSRQEIAEFVAGDDSKKGGLDPEQEISHDTEAKGDAQLEVQPLKSDMGKMFR